MKIFKHIKYLFRKNKRVLLSLLSGAFLPMLLLIAVLILRLSEIDSNNKKTYDFIMIFISTVMNLSEIAYAFSLRNEKDICLFKLLRFCFLDILIYAWIKSSISTVITAAVTAMVINEYTRLKLFVPVFLLWMLLITCVTTLIYYLFLWNQESVRWNKPKNNRVKEHKYRISSKYVASLVSLYIGGENKITLWLDHIIIWIVIIGGNTLKAPPYIIIYLIYALILCSIFDMAVSDEKNYALNKLLRRSAPILRKEKLKFCEMFVVLYTAVSILVALICGTSASDISTLIIFICVLFVYFSFIAIATTKIIYDRYPNIKSGGNFIVLMMMMLVMPGIGFVVSIIIIFKGALRDVLHQ